MRHLFVCDCGDIEHQFVVSCFDPPEDDEFVYIHIHLTPMNFWRRLKTAVQYALGRQSRFGAFGEILLTQQQCLQLSELLAQQARGTDVQRTQNQSN